jgi:hypothetical protein
MKWIEFLKGVQLHNVHSTFSPNNSNYKPNTHFPNKPLPLHTYKRESSRVIPASEDEKIKIRGFFNVITLGVVRLMDCCYIQGTVISVIYIRMYLPFGRDFTARIITASSALSFL